MLLSPFFFAAICTCGCRVGSANPCSLEVATVTTVVIRFASSFGESDCPGWSASNRGEPLDTKIRVLDVKSSVLSWWTVTQYCKLVELVELMQWVGSWCNVLNLSGSISSCSFAVPIAAFRRNLVPWTNWNTEIPRKRYPDIQSSKLKTYSKHLTPCSLFSEFCRSLLKGGRFVQGKRGQ